MNTRLCAWCLEPLTRKPHEPAARFLQRTHCDRSCSASAREAAIDRIPLGACEACGVAFYHGFHGRPHCYWRARRFCSTRCATAPAVIRWETEENGCWTWIASPPYPDGYARIPMPDGRRISAHRVIYAERVRPLERRESLHHICRNRLCVNPDHLQPLTRSEHMALHWNEDRGHLRTLSSGAA